MPLSEKDGKELLKNIGKYLEEGKWLKHDIDDLERKGKLTKEDAKALRKKQSEAQKRREALEKVIISKFPEKFGKPPLEKKTTPKKEQKEVKVVPKEEPEIITIKKGVLERINDTLEVQADYFKSIEDLTKQQLESFNTIKGITEEEKAIQENYTEITYPAAGGTETIPSGMTVLDLWTGDVTLGDGTTDRLSDSLMAVGQLYVRSIYVDCDKEFSVQLDGKSKHTIAANDYFARKGIQCRRIFIDTDQSTNLKFWASTNPNAAIEEMRNVVVTGVETPLASRQSYWHYRTSTYLSANSIGTLSIYDIPTSERFILNDINITCEKSCIQILEFSITASGGTTYWRGRKYDAQGEFKFKDTVLNAGEVLKVRMYNDTNETLYFRLEVGGLEELI